VPQRVQGAWDFIKWFTSPAEHLKYATQTGHLPLRKSETKLPAYKAYLAKFPWSAVVSSANLDNVTKARPTSPPIRASRRHWDSIQAVLLGKMDAAAGAVQRRAAGQRHPGVRQ